STWETQLRKGVVELAVLATIARGETYGYRIVEDLQARSGLELTESTVYPVLTRLARDGALAGREERSSAGPARRVCPATTAGAAVLPAHRRGPGAVRPDGRGMAAGVAVGFRLTRRSADMTIGTAVLSGPLQALVDARLDTLDRMLLGRVPRSDRRAIVDEVE